MGGEEGKRRRMIKVKTLKGVRKEKPWTLFNPRVRGGKMASLSASVAKKSPRASKVNKER